MCEPLSYAYLCLGKHVEGFLIAFQRKTHQAKTTQPESE